MQLFRYSRKFRRCLGKIVINPATKLFYLIEVIRSLIGCDKDHSALTVEIDV